MSFSFENRGFCPICESNVKFVAKSEWFRDFYLCGNCGSIPRERALMEVIKHHFPNWREATVHESSPGVRGTSARLKKECREYIPSQFFLDRRPGEMVKGVRCENLEALTFADESIDLHVTQDVMEHVFHPDRAFAEIARTLRPGGMHICTVPLVNKWSPTRRRASIDEAGHITHHLEESYHGNPIGDGKSLPALRRVPRKPFLFRSRRAPAGEAAAWAIATLQGEVTGEAPEAVPACARWLNDDWGARDGYSYRDTLDWLRGIAAASGNERGLVALLGEEPAGIGLLVDCDLEARSDLTPWLSGLFVPPARRGRSIGRQLVAGIEELARGQGFPEIYLYTRTATGLYLKLGWRVLERFPHLGRDFELMRKEL